MEAYQTMNGRFTRHLVCPWCSKGEVLANGKAQVTISTQCPRCRRFFRADLDTLKTECAQPQRRLGAHTAD